MPDLMPQMEIPASLQVNVPITDEVRNAITNVGEASRLANAYAIDCPELAQAAQGDIARFNQQISRIEAWRNDLLIEPQKSIDKIKAWFNPGINDRKNAITVLKAKLAGWIESERQRVERVNRERAEAERKARQEAEAKAAAEMARAEQEASEKLRQAREAEERRKQAEAEGNSRAAAAEAARAAKLQQEADSRLETGAAKAQEAHVEAAAVKQEVIEAPKIQGFSQAAKWIAEFEPGKSEQQVKALIAAGAGDRPELLALFDLNMGTCNKWASGQHEAMRIPGMVAKKTFVSRASKK